MKFEQKFFLIPIKTFVGRCAFEIKKKKMSEFQEIMARDFKILVIGNSGGGKSSLIQRYVDGSFTDFTKPTVT